jgi:hypothetical protein
MRQTLAIAILIPLLTVLAACGGGQREPAAEARLYEVHGVIEQLPDPAQPGSELQIRHEAIPTFMSSDNKVVGMKAMTMPFPVADGVSLQDLNVGDSVAFSLEVQWDRSPAFLVTRLERVESPPDAEVEPMDPTAASDDEVEDQPTDEEPQEERHNH